MVTMDGCLAFSCLAQTQGEDGRQDAVRNRDVSWCPDRLPAKVTSCRLTEYFGSPHAWARPVLARGCTALPRDTAAVLQSCN